MTLPTPPYTYDDPRLTYDEHCFFYDGGYDDVCLAGPTAVVVRRGGYKKRERKPELPFISIFIQSCLVQVNNVFYPEIPKFTRFAGTNAPLSIYINGVQFDTRVPYVNGEIIQALKQKPELNAYVQFLESLNNKSDEEIMAENLKSAVENVELQTVENYKKITVESSLVEDKPEVSVRSALIKDKS